MDNVTETPKVIYHRILGEINKADQGLAHCVFQCVAVASRPLHVQELTEFFASDFMVRPIPKFHEYQRWKVDAVLSMCSNLLAVDSSSIVHFLDPSVKEYLISAHLSDFSDDTASPLYHVFKTPAHTCAAQACLAILLHLDNNITRDNLQKYPLAEYAAEHWIDHARFEYVQQDVEEGLRCLFDPSKQHLAVLVWIHDPAIPWCWRTQTCRAAERPSQPSGTHLYYAAYYGLHSIVKYLITEHQLDVHSGFSGSGGSTPLHVASSRGHMEVARILLYYGGDATAQDNFWRRTPLDEASNEGHAQVARILLKYGADATAHNKLGTTPLHLACRGGHVEVARILLEYGADAKAKGKYGWTPLHDALSVGHMELVRILLEHGADMSRWTPNCKASSGGHVGPVRMLLDHGADVNARNEHRSTLLHLASKEDIVLSLLEHGADMTAVDGSGYTPLLYACLLGQEEVTRTLLKHGADMTARNSHLSSPLHLASYMGHVRLVRMLLEHGADANAQDVEGQTPLHEATGKRYAEIAQVLLENGADVDAEDADWNTPLRLAVMRYNVEVARVLLDHGADKHARGKLGTTPADLARNRMSKFKDLPQLLPDPPPLPVETSGAEGCCIMQ